MTIKLFQEDSIGISRLKKSLESDSDVDCHTWYARVGIARGGCVALLLICGLVLAPPKSNADVIRKANLKSSVAEVVLPVESVESVSFWAELKGNSSNVVSFRVEAPQGTKVEFAGAQAGNRGKTKIEALKQQAWYPLVLKDRYKDGAKEGSVFTMRRVGRSALAQNVTTGNGSDAFFDKSLSSSLARITGFGNFDICSFLSAEQLNKILEQLKGYTGQEWTKDKFCEFAKNPSEEGAILPGAPGAGAGGGGNTGGSGFPNDPTDEAFLANLDNSSLDVAGVFRKDSCNSRVSKYFVRVTMNLSEVDAAKFPQGIVVRFRGLENIYEGSRAASIKPVSDGKFAPAPLLLMNSVSYDENIQVMKWTKGKPKKVADVDVEDKVYYRGFVLSRSVASSILNGGYASVDNVSDYQAYGACLNMVKSRQRVNGYPGE
jgi:hypothetical protein